LPIIGNRLKIPKVIVKVADASFNIVAKLAPNKSKRIRELYYWKFVKGEEKELSSNHYSQFFTSHFNLNESYYNGKKILDIGCGPRGSLEWAEMASERIGLDPLADKYLKLGAANHKMTYINAPAENIPFEEKHFDIITSFNSLDHVDDIDQTVSEIKRVLKLGGIFLLITELNHEPTVAEPITFSWDIVKKFEPEFEIVEERHYEKRNGIYKSLRENILYDHSNLKQRPGVLSVKFRKK